MSESCGCLYSIHVVNGVVAGRELIRPCLSHGPVDGVEIWDETHKVSELRAATQRVRGIIQRMHVEGRIVVQHLASNPNPETFKIRIGGIEIDTNNCADGEGFTIPARKETPCHTCQAMNDLGVKVCWKCGNAP